MPILLKSVAGLFAGVAVGALSLVYWPQVQTSPIAAAARPVVEQPQKLAPPPAVAAAPAQVGVDKEALGKLAEAFHAQPADHAQPAEPTRGLTLTNADATIGGPTDEARRFRAQGLVALAGGDVVAARAFLERAADAGDARALLVLGDAYDPVTLTRLGALGVKGDPSRAREYYQRASTAGLAAARERIAIYQPTQ